MVARDMAKENNFKQCEVPSDIPHCWGSLCHRWLPESGTPGGFSSHPTLHTVRGTCGAWCHHTGSGEISLLDLMTQYETIWDNMRPPCSYRWETHWNQVVTWGFKFPLYILVCSWGQKKFLKSFLSADCRAGPPETWAAPGAGPLDRAHLLEYTSSEAM